MPENEVDLLSEKEMWRGYDLFKKMGRMSPDQIKVFMKYTSEKDKYALRKFNEYAGNYADLNGHGEKFGPGAMASYAKSKGKEYRESIKAMMKLDSRSMADKDGKFSKDLTFIDKAHPDRTAAHRFRNVTTNDTPEEVAAQIRLDNKDLDVEVIDRKVYVRTPGSKEVYTEDPDPNVIDNPIEFMKDLPADIAEMAIPMGVGAGEAGLMSIMETFGGKKIKAIKALSGGSKLAKTGAGLAKGGSSFTGGYTAGYLGDMLRQYIGKGMGVGVDGEGIDHNRANIAGVTGGALPFVFGNASSKSALAKAGLDPKDVRAFGGNRGKAADFLAGDTGLAGKLADRIGAKFGGPSYQDRQNYRTAQSKVLQMEEDAYKNAVRNAEKGDEGYVDAVAKEGGRIRDVNSEALDDIKQQLGSSIEEGTLKLKTIDLSQTNNIIQAQINALKREKYQKGAGGELIEEELAALKNLQYRIFHREHINKDTIKSKAAFLGEEPNYNEIYEFEGSRVLKILEDLDNLVSKKKNRDSLTKDEGYTMKNVGELKKSIHSAIDFSEIAARNTEPENWVNTPKISEYRNAYSKNMRRRAQHAKMGILKVGEDARVREGLEHYEPNQLEKDYMKENELGTDFIYSDQGVTSRIARNVSNLAEESRKFKTDTLDMVDKGLIKIGDGNRKIYQKALKIPEDQHVLRKAKDWIDPDTTQVPGFGVTNDQPFKRLLTPLAAATGTAMYGGGGGRSSIPWALTAAAVSTPYAAQNPKWVKGRMRQAFKVDKAIGDPYRKLTGKIGEMAGGDKARLMEYILARQAGKEAIQDNPEYAPIAMGGESAQPDMAISNLMQMLQDRLNPEPKQGGQ